MIKKRWTLFSVLMVMSVICAVSVLRMRAANPTSGSIGPASSPVSWDGTAAGGTHNGEGTCVEGVNCDTFRLTVLPGDWTGKRIQVTVSWVSLATDYDVYIHKCPNSGSTNDQCNATGVIDSSTGAANTAEIADINPAIDGTGDFTVRVAYFTGQLVDQYHADATVVTGDAPPPPTPPRSPNWIINYHGECCEGNLAAAGDNTYVLLPVLVQGNKIKKSSDGGKTWTQKYPPVPASVPYGIEGDMQAFGDDAIFFGTELADAVIAHSDDEGENWTLVQTPLISAGNDQAWSYLGPFGNLRPGGALPTDEPYVLAGWMRIGTGVFFSFDGGLTWPIQTPLVGVNGSGPLHQICRDNAQLPTNPGDTRVANSLFARQKSGRHGSWGTDRKFYWTEAASGQLYTCQTGDLGVNWTGNKHPLAAGPGSGSVVSHSAFDNRGTFYVLHGNKLYVSFNQGKSMAFVHTLPRWGDAGRSDSGSDQFFVVDCGTIHIGLLEDAGEGNGRVFYLRGTGVDTATPVWEEELVDVVGFVRLDFMYIILDGNGIPTISYTTPEPPGTVREVTTASRLSATSPACIGPVSAVSRKIHGTPGVSFDINLPLIGNPGIECRKGTGVNGKDFQVVFTFAAPITGVDGVTVSSKDGLATADSPIVNNQTVTVNLHNVANEQMLFVTLQDATDGTTTGNVGVPIGILAGDTNADRRVNVGDTNQTRSRSGQLTNDTNKRSDVNLDGRVNVGDTNFVRARSGDSIDQ